MTHKPLLADAQDELQVDLELMVVVRLTVVVLQAPGLMLLAEHEHGLIQVEDVEPFSF